MTVRAKVAGVPFFVYGRTATPLDRLGVLDNVNAAGATTCIVTASVLYAVAGAFSTCSVALWLVPCKPTQYWGTVVAVNVTGDALTASLG